MLLWSPSSSPWLLTMMSINMITMTIIIICRVFSSPLQSIITLYYIASSWRILMTAIMVVLCWSIVMSYDINLHIVWPFCHNTIIITIIIIIIIWFSYHRRRLALHYHQSWSMANDRTMDPYRPITIHPSMIDKMNEQSMDDSLESIDHLSIDERTIDTRSKKIW